MAYIYRQTKLSRKAVAGIIAACVAGALLFAAGVQEASQSVSSNLRAEAADSIEQTVLERAVQCYAVEGAYPPNLQYLEDNYGLRVNQDDYYVTYEAFGSNVLPTVQVIEKNRG